MSSILEALRKLEEEKAARRNGTGNIAGKVTAPGRRPRQKSAWLVPAAMSAVAVTAILGTYAAMGGFSSRHGAAAVATIAPASPLTPPTSRQAATLSGESPPRPIPAAVAAPKTSAKSAAAPSAAATAPPAAKRAAPATPAESPAVQPAGAEAPALNVSGIAWQKDNASRLAMINGTPVSEGSTVAGARVEEIFPDRVRFSYRGRSFDISLGPQ